MIINHCTEFISSWDCLFHYMSVFNTYEFKGVVPTIDKNKLGVLSLCLLELLEVTTLRECLSSSAKNSFVLYDALCPNPINNATRRKRVSRKLCMLRERVFFHRTCWLLLYMHIKNIACMRDVDKKRPCVRCGKIVRVMYLLLVVVVWSVDEDDITLCWLPRCCWWCWWCSRKWKSFAWECW